jgi:uncharacterized surface protein with fasciclin (FAS1) repeats
MRGLKKLAVVMVVGSLACGGRLAQAQSKDLVDTAVEAGSFKTLAAALTAADLVDALKGKGPFTVFAPTDEAFAKLPKELVASLLKPENKQRLVGILTYHVAKGKLPAEKVVTLSGVKTLNGQQIDLRVAKDQVLADQATIVKTDIACSNGVIHVIDQVLIPAEDTLVVTADKAGNFKTLIAAAKAAGLVEPLIGDAPLTVFAPTDAAFAKLPPGTVESLLKPENKAKLANILKYHVVSGRVYSSDAVAAGKAVTLQGQPVEITVNGDVARVNEAKLVAVDLDASNGVIHVIDSVLLPPETSQAAAHPRKMIEAAISEGAPLYNAGHSGECARIYMQTVEQLLSTQNGRMHTSTQRTLESALHSARGTSCSDSQAWTLRHALDAAYRTMASTP